jgi:hypothetical protein
MERALRGTASALSVTRGVEFIPAYDWEVTLAAPPYVTASGSRGTGQGIGDWPLFLVKYRLGYANENNGDYIVTAFFQMSNQ